MHVRIRPVIFWYSLRYDRNGKETVKKLIYWLLKCSVCHFTVCDVYVQVTPAIDILGDGQGVNLIDFQPSYEFHLVLSADILD